jgi:hypothetical protein
MPLIQDDPYYECSATQLDRLDDAAEAPAADSEPAALVQLFKSESADIVQMLQSQVSEIALVISKLKEHMDKLPPHYLCDLVVMASHTTFLERLAILNAVDLAERFALGLKLLARQSLVLNTTMQVAARDKLNSKKKSSSGAGAGPLQRRQPTFRIGPGGAPSSGAQDDDEQEEGNVERFERQVTALSAGGSPIRFALLLFVSDLALVQHQKSLRYLPDLGSSWPVKYVILLPFFVLFLANHALFSEPTYATAKLGTLGVRR